MQVQKLFSNFSSATIAFYNPHRNVQDFQFSAFLSVELPAVFILVVIIAVYLVPQSVVCSFCSARV